MHITLGSLRGPQLCHPFIVNSGNVLDLSRRDHRLPITGSDAATTAHFPSGLVAAANILGELRDRIPPVDQFRHGGRG